MTTPRNSIISVKVPIALDKMTDAQKTRLDRITGRDTRVIKAYLGVIQRHERELLSGAHTCGIDTSQLDRLTLTATRGLANRTSVEHDLKRCFPNISFNELQECRDVAVAIWHSYLQHGGSMPLQSRKYRAGKIPRLFFTRCFELLHRQEQPIRHWLRIRDSLNSVRENRREHDHLLIPLNTSAYHLNRLKEGPVKTARILRDGERKWWAIFTVALTSEAPARISRPPAVLAIDLGVKRAACSVLLTQRGYKHVKFWTQDDKHQRMHALDLRIDQLHRRRETLLLAGGNADGVNSCLMRLRHKRERISIEHDRRLAKEMAKYIQTISATYDLYVTVGRVKGIRGRARRGNYKGNAFRGMIHRWTYARALDLLEQKLGEVGITEDRIVTVPEAWTSITCHKCGSRGTRPRQNLFACNTCGYRADADLNGAINIGRRLIMLIPSLRDEKGLGMWLLPREKPTPKARRSVRPNGKSPPPERSPPSMKGGSAVDCHDQTSLARSVSSEDPAVANAVERLAGRMGNGDPCERIQRNEAALRVRESLPMNSDKAHISVQCNAPARAGDCRCGKGRTQKLRAMSSLPDSQSNMVFQKAAGSAHSDPRPQSIK